MQALLGELFPWIAGLWALDGLAQLGRGHLLLAGRPGRARLLGAGVRYLGLSPLGEVVAAHDLPFLPGDGRVHLFDPRRRSEPALVSAEDLEPVPAGELGVVEREGRKVRAAGRVVLVAPTPAWAERLRADLEALGAGGGPIPVPGAADEGLEAARRLRDRQRPYAAAAGALASVLFAGTFVAWPAAAYVPGGAGIPAGALLAALGVLVLAIAAVTLAMLVACGEGLARALGGALHLALFPVAALRPLAHAPRSLYRPFDAPTVAAALLSREAFAAWGARELRRARLSRAATPLDVAVAWEARIRRIEGLLAATGTPAEDALRPPGRTEGAAAWCPLCASQYLPGHDACVECGVGLERFGEA